MLKKRSLQCRMLIILLPVILGVFVYQFREFLIHLGTRFPACPSYRYLGIYCPGCGNTRSVQQLLSGNVVGAIGYNPLPLIGILLFVMLYIEFIMISFGKQIKIVPRSKKFWAGFAFIFVLYFVLRNF